MYITLVKIPIEIMYITIYNYVHNKEMNATKERAKGGKHEIRKY